MAECGAFHLGDIGSSFRPHQPGKIIDHRTDLDGLRHCGFNQQCRIIPAQVLEHHHAGENYRPWIDLILPGIFRRCAMGRFKTGMAGEVMNISSRGNSQPANLCRQGIGDVVPIEVHRCDDIIFSRPGKDLLQEIVSDGVLDQEFASRGISATVLPAYRPITESSFATS